MALIVARQSVNDSASLCLTGGDLANEVYSRMAELTPQFTVRPDDIHLWWNWDYFIATDDPQRNSLQALSRLAGAAPLDPAKIHPVPSSSTTPDPESGAAQYAQELKEAAPIDVCLLELGSQGQIAGLYPPIRRYPESVLVAGVTGVPGDDRHLITMTDHAIGLSSEVWVMASGLDVAPALHQLDSAAATFLPDDEDLLWFADHDAVTQLPFHHCTL
jgi:6-phosphogluconolactonase